MILLGITSTNQLATVPALCLHRGARGRMLARIRYQSGAPRAFHLQTLALILKMLDEILNLHLVFFLLTFLGRAASDSQVRI